MRCGNPTRLMRLATVVPHKNCVIIVLRQRENSKRKVGMAFVQDGAL